MVSVFGIASREYVRQKSAELASVAAYMMSNCKLNKALRVLGDSSSGNRAHYSCLAQLKFSINP